jgi:hypothetical protein
MICCSCRVSLRCSTRPLGGLANWRPSSSPNSRPVPRLQKVLPVRDLERVVPRVDIAQRANHAELRRRVRVRRDLTLSRGRRCTRSPSAGSSPTSSCPPAWRDPRSDSPTRTGLSADHHVHLRQLLERRLLRLERHPRVGLNARGHRHLQVRHQLRHHRCRRGWEVGFDVGAPEQLAERRVDERRTTLPSRPLREDAAERLQNVETAVDESRRQIRRRLIRDVERFPRLQRRERRLVVDLGDVASTSSAPSAAASWTPERSSADWPSSKTGTIGPRGSMPSRPAASSGGTRRTEPRPGKVLDAEAALRSRRPHRR